MIESGHTIVYGHITLTAHIPRRSAVSASEDWPYFQGRSARFPGESTIAGKRGNHRFFAGVFR